MKTPSGQWRCPHCGDPGTRYNFPPDPPAAELKTLLHQALKGDPETILRLIGFLDSPDEDEVRESAGILARSISRSAEPLIQHFTALVRAGIHSRQRDRIFSIIIGNHKKISQDLLTGLLSLTKSESEIVQLLSCMETTSDPESFGIIIGFLSHESPVVREKVIEIAGSDSRSIVPFIQSLTTTIPDPEKILLIGALKKSGDPRAKGVLLRILGETKNREIGEMIIDSIIETADTESVLPLTELLQKSGSDPERLAIIRALASFRDSRANQVLFHVFRITDSQVVKKRAADALFASEDPDIADSVTRYFQVTSSVTERLLLLDIVRLNLKHELFDPLMELLREVHDIEYRNLIISMIAKTCNTRAVRHLRKALTEMNTTGEKILLIRCLGTFRDQGPKTVLIRLLHTNPDRELKKAIVTSLLENRDENTAEILIGILQSADYDYERLILIEALGNLGDPRSVDTLRSLCHRTHEADLKNAIANALEKIRRSPG
jgi:HEAT repeat protein